MKIERLTRLSNVAIQHFLVPLCCFLSKSDSITLALLIPIHRFISSVPCFSYFLLLFCVRSSGLNRDLISIKKSLLLEHSPCFNLITTILRDLVNVSEFFCTWIQKPVTKFRIRKTKLLASIYVPHETCFTSQSCNGKEGYKNAWCTCKVVFLNSCASRFFPFSLLYAVTLLSSLSSLSN